MWNKVSSNKTLQKISKQQAYRKHITSLYRMKSTLNIKPPAEYRFLKTNPKAQLKKRQRENEIEKKNNILVQRILQNGPTIKPTSVYMKQSLNSKVVRQKQRQVDMENQRLVKKLKSVNSQYSKHKLQKDAQNYDRLKSSMAYSRMHQTYDLLQHTQIPMGKTRMHSHRPRTAKV